jgi:hypothetical protein
MADIEPQDAEDVMIRLRAQFKTENFKTNSKSRRGREKKVRSAVDGRTLKATGRTEQFNFKCTPDIKRGVVEAADEEGISMAEWLNRGIAELLKARGKI